MLRVGVHVGLAAEQGSPVLRARVLDRLFKIGGIGVIGVELLHVVVGHEPAYAAEVPAPVGPVGHQGVVGRIVREREMQVVDDVELHLVAGDQVLVHPAQAGVNSLLKLTSSHANLIWSMVNGTPSDHFMPSRRRMV